jgi:hypothetical protein
MLVAVRSPSLSLAVLLAEIRARRVRNFKLAKRLDSGPAKMFVCQISESYLCTVNHGER